MKKMIEHHIFHCQKNSVLNHVKIAKIANRNFKDWLFGYICYVNSIEPELAKVYYEDFDKIDWPI